MTKGVGKLGTPLGDEDLGAIGRITANFALLEETISTCIGRLVGAGPAIGQIITAELPFRRLLPLLSSLYRHRTSNDEAIAQLDTLLGRVAQAGEKRNLITHSLWGADHTGEKIARIKATARKRKGLKHQFEEMTTSDLDAIADFTATVADEVRQFMSHIDEE